MGLKNYKRKEIPLEKLEEVMRKMEDTNDPDGFHEFRDTAIYHSFKFEYNLRVNKR